MKNDIIKPLQRSKLHTDNSKVEKSDKWALDTQKKCQSIEKLPKFQQFKEYYFPQKNSEQEEKYKTTFNIDFVIRPSKFDENFKNEIIFQLI